MKNQLAKLKSDYDQKIKLASDAGRLSEIYLEIFGSSGKFSQILDLFKKIPSNDKKEIGRLLNSTKDELLTMYNDARNKIRQSELNEKIDVTLPAQLPPMGHLHIVSQAIEEISRIFERIGFYRVEYPEIEWEWFAFESLNMPPNHPARDDFETFFVDAKQDPKLGKIVLSPHTSSGQVREMQRLKGKPPIRMINIAKCYRPNWDVSHTPMFHQFEGLVVDEGINITHLKGTLSYFAREFFGSNREIRLRPFHFQFTEPSFEVDITCGICKGSGIIDKEKCRFCKAGWLELGGAGMVHPNVLKAGSIDTSKFTGFAFGWGIERTFMMKSNTNLDDLRILFQNDIRFLEQF